MESRPIFRHVLHLATTEGTPRISLCIAIVVGTVLNLINQGDALLAGAEISLPKVLLTYCVPYGVSTYGAVTAKMRRK